MSDLLRNEVRLGLVLYGGVSLAIYINGVAQEFWNIVKGRGPYRLLKALIDADVVVDIVSGTSAGGINGVLLAYALANDRDFKHCAKLWREHADFQRMLRPIDAKAPPSMLDGEGYFHDRLVDIYRTLPPWTPEPYELKPNSTERRWESKLEALDLFVTGTDYDGEVSTRVDALGHAIDIKDHRKVFKLKYREGRANDFEAAWDDGARPPRTQARSDGRVRALATISRCTSSFPGAFPPTVVQEAPPSSSVPGATPSSPPTAAAGDEADAFVRMWGNFTQRTDFLDGGVLDNKPFTYTIRDIYMRTAERQVVRKLFYVEPDPERHVRAVRNTSPDILSVVLSSLVGIPGYESIAQDLQEIDDRNARLKRYEEITSILREKRVDRVRGRGTGGGGGPVVDFTPSDVQRAIHAKSRATQMRDRFGDGIRMSPTRTDPAQVAVIASLADGLVSQFDALPPEKRDALLRRYDVDYAMRRLFYVSYELYGSMYGKSGEPSPRSVNLLAALNREIQVLKVVQYGVERLRAMLSGLPKTVATVSDLWGRVQGMMETLLAWPAPGGTGTGAVAWSTGQELPDRDDVVGWAAWLPDSGIQVLREELATRLDGIAKSLETGISRPRNDDAPTLVRALQHDTDRILDHMLGESLEDLEIRAAWDGFEEVDAYLFPLEYLSNLQAKDRIDVVRVSPVDATLGFGRERQGADKIAGDTLYHFGGFFKRSWRSNDILWGRLDALDLLFECLLTPARVEAATEGTGRRDRLKRYLAGGDDPSTFQARTVVEQIFPHSPGPVKERISGWLDALLAEPQPGGTGGRDPRPGLAAQVEPGDEMLEILVRASQLEVIEEDLPDVIQDAVDETVEWGSTKRLTRSGEEGYERLDVDALVGDVIKAMAGQVIRPSAPEPAPMAPGGWLAARLTNFVKSAMGMTAPIRRRLIDDPGEFFARRYRVGGEDIRRDIPPLILVQTFAHALIVFKNALLGVPAARGAASPAAVPKIVRWLLDYPLWIVYSLATLVRRQPRLGFLHVAVAAVAVALLVVGLVWREAIWWPKEGLKLRAAAGFVIVPALTLLVQLVWLRWVILSRGRFSRLVLWLRVAGAVLAAALVLWGWSRGEYHDWLRAIVRTTRGALGAWQFYVFVVVPVALFFVNLRVRSRRSSSP